MKRLLPLGILALSIIPLGVTYGDSHCNCSKECSAACEEGKGEDCACDSCDCSKSGNCEHGKCAHGKKAKKAKSKPTSD